MPIIRIETNVEQSKISKTLAQDLTKAVAEGMNKEAKWFAVTIATSPNITFGGTNAPCALTDLTSIGSLGVEENKKISKIISDVVCPGLGIEPTRMYICYHDLTTSHIGYNGTTFHEIFGA